MADFQKGKLIDWNDEKGFGFIAPANGDKNVFIHISALKKSERRPQMGNIIYYQTTIDQQGRFRAADAYIGDADCWTIDKQPSGDIPERHASLNQRYNRNSRSPASAYRSSAKRTQGAGWSRLISSLILIKFLSEALQLTKNTHDKRSSLHRIFLLAANRNHYVSYQAINVMEKCTVRKWFPVTKPNFT